jgi:lipase maturation factor 1
VIDLSARSASVVRWTFVRGLALVWLAAFVSLGVQVTGLAGRDGILPAGAYLESARDAAGGAPIARLPTLCWWLGAGDTTLQAMCAAGAALALLLALGVLPGFVSLLLWALYLSLAVACTTFLDFQWDALLLETGWITVFLAPWKIWAPGTCPERLPSRVALALLRLLLFKLMFLSGVAKLASGDPHWRDLTALQYHYWTTCLPTWSGWFANQLPAWFQRASVAGMLAVELAVPFLLFAPIRSARIAAVALIASLQIGIALTGNYGFFNLLTLVLCIPALDDEAVLACLPERIRARIPPPSGEPRVARWRHVPALAIAAILVPLSLAQMQARAFGHGSLPRFALRALVAEAPFRSVNSYGLFATMTTRRYEIEVEGSADGRHWSPYAFRWKPGDPARRPEFAGLHMPRLDWQMWFAALSDWRSQTWFMHFLERLLQGSPPVRKLLVTDPFPRSPPRFVRAVAWDYHFSSAAERAATGAWWTRNRIGLYCPVLERDEDGRVHWAEGTGVYSTSAR